MVGPPSLRRKVARGLAGPGTREIVTSGRPRAGALASRAVPGEIWRYRLEVLPLPRPESSEDSFEQEGVTRLDERADWELVPQKVSDDGRTEQRVYRKPA